MTPPPASAFPSPGVLASFQASFQESLAYRNPHKYLSIKRSLPFRTCHSTINPFAGFPMAGLAPPPVPVRRVFQMRHAACGCGIRAPAQGPFESRPGATRLEKRPYRFRSSAAHVGSLPDPSVLYGAEGRMAGVEGRRASRGLHADLPVWRRQGTQGCDYHGGQQAAPRQGFLEPHVRPMSVPEGCPRSSSGRLPGHQGRGSAALPTEARAVWTVRPITSVSGAAEGDTAIGPRRHTAGPRTGIRRRGPGSGSAFCRTAKSRWCCRRRRQMRTPRCADRPKRTSRRTMGSSVLHTP